jgi:dienelactone hydrolase
MATILGALTVPAAGRASAPVNPIAEVQNLAVSGERSAEWSSPSTLAQVASATLVYQQQRAAIKQHDPGRDPDPNSCTTGLLCPVDPYLNHFADGDGIVEPVLYTARDGATISGHVWATRTGPASRPGIVLITGSIVGYEQGYWYLAQALAKSGFVVLTFDVQGEGDSDQFGAPPDQLEDLIAGTPPIGAGGGFYDGGEDAIDFLLSTRSHPYVPVPSRSTGTSHAAKQAQRVAQGLDNGYDPLWQMLDPNEIGVAGHSYGAEAASWIGQQDPRVKAVVALDNLCVPTWPIPTEVDAFVTDFTTYGNLLAAPSIYGLPPECFGATAGPAPAMTKPSLGISADYLVPTPYLTAPNPQFKEAASLDFSKAGADSGEVVIRGGTHLDFADVPVPGLPASLRGADLVAWYTTAWFQKYLLHDPAADARLTTSRWRDDAATGQVDPGHDPNVFSYDYLSRMDITLANGTRFDCENLRAGCSGQTTAADDCGSASYSYRALDTAPDTSDNEQCETPSSAPAPHSCPATRAVTLTLPRVHGAIVRAAVYVDGRRLALEHGRRLRTIHVRVPATRATTVLVVSVGRGGVRRTLRRTLPGC